MTRLIQPLIGLIVGSPSVKRWLFQPGSRQYLHTYRGSRSFWGRIAYPRSHTLCRRNTYIRCIFNVKCHQCGNAHLTFANISECIHTVHRIYSYKMTKIPAILSEVGLMPVMNWIEGPYIGCIYKSSDISVAYLTCILESMGAQRIMDVKPVVNNFGEHLQ